MDSSTKDKDLQKQLNKAFATLMLYAAEDDFLSVIRAAKEESKLPDTYESKPMFRFKSGDVIISKAVFNIDQNEAVLWLHTKKHEKVKVDTRNIVVYLQKNNENLKKLAKEMQECIKQIWQEWTKN